uniref:Uncharacterized protein n=1 Tax=viral metagenome TaxID=1070528 RepID=A0A6C0CGU4_9ZZZZ
MAKELESSLDKYVDQKVKEILSQLDQIKLILADPSLDNNPALIALSFAMQSISKQAREL